LGASFLLQGKIIQRIFSGVLITLEISAVSIIISLILGIAIGIAISGNNKIINGIYRIYLEAVRIIPLLVWLFVFFFGVTKALNIHIDGLIVSVIVFCIWGTAEAADIVRASILSIPVSQTENGKAIALTNLQIKLYIIFPQAVKRMIPSIINLSTRMIKTTTLVSQIGVIEAVKVGQQVIEVTGMTNPSSAFWVYGLLFLIFFAICYPLSLLSRNLERRWGVAE